MSETENPYNKLGKKLKSFRERASESAAECSGAVEIEMTDLLRFEQGKKRPPEEVLLLLISHFGLKEDEAMSLWDLAGYSTDKLPSSHVTADELGEIVQQVLVMPIDLRVAYTDKVHVAANKEGVIINFLQNSGIDTKSVPVARVGMSREQAARLLKVLEQGLKLSTAEYSKNNKTDKPSS